MVHKSNGKKTGYPISPKNDMTFRIDTQTIESQQRCRLCLLKRDLSIGKYKGSLENRVVVLLNKEEKIE